MHNAHSSHLGAGGVAAFALAALFAGCGGGDGEPADRADRPEGPRQERQPDLQPATCPPAADNCESASGTIVYVERVDPDGDGDAHFVLASRDGVTAPGITVVDVRADLRPHPLPGPGDELSAAGPVYEGSYGQRQIQAENVNVAR